MASTSSSIALASHHRDDDTKRHNNNKNRFLEICRNINHDNVMAFVDDIRIAATTTVPMNGLACLEQLQMHMQKTSEYMTLASPYQKLFPALWFIHMFPACREVILTKGWVPSLEHRDQLVDFIQTKLIIKTTQPSDTLPASCFASDICDRYMMETI